MKRLLDHEARAVALLRARWRLIALTAAASLGTAASFAVALAPEELERATLEVLTFGAVVLTLIVGHGMISADLRSGAALLWLQKPVRPVPFFVRRALEVTALGVALTLALWGFGASIGAFTLGLEGARGILGPLPGILLVVVGVCVMLFGFSAWGIPSDSLFVVAFFFAGTFTTVAGGVAAEVISWVALPAEATATLTRFLGGGGGSGVGRAFLLYGRFLTAWIAFGVAGLLLSTRSPIPREASR